MQARTVRQLALELPDAEERETWETATFRVRNRIFVMFSDHERELWIKSTHDEQHSDRPCLVERLHEPFRRRQPPRLGDELAELVTVDSSDPNADPSARADVRRHEVHPRP